MRSGARARRSTAGSGVGGGARVSRRPTDRPAIIVAESFSDASGAARLRFGGACAEGDDECAARALDACRRRGVGAGHARCAAAHAASRRRLAAHDGTRFRRYARRSTRKPINTNTRLPPV
ncbi:hypothetical protein C7S16_5054 [Burkholderia thailandensis]|uniref:Uncharacterized protein n=1 Tax=Burkholderia thailandensis TaxID=57975 RepID=A0AAW9CP53_BURTH|nr:hypothetical protein [Burkholderia thailandensis]MDW9251356.1 hypothetical protein [Burkholderia thailandensis]